MVRGNGLKIYRDSGLVEIELDNGGTAFFTIKEFEDHQKPDAEPIEIPGYDGNYKDTTYLTVLSWQRVDPETPNEIIGFKIVA